MFSLKPNSSVGDQASESVNRTWPQPRILITSGFDPSQIEGQLFSPGSPVSAELHHSRIEELLFSPTSPIDNLMASRGPNYGVRIPQLLLRSFDELHTEHSYLLDCLQTENHKATELLRTIPQLEERLIHNDESFCRRRKVKKRLGWLRRRLNETSHQEKKILARLGQLTFEIQIRERWTQIEFEQRQREVEYQQQCFNYQQAFYGMQQIQLNPATPNFQPQGYLPYTPWSSAQWQQWQYRDGQEGSGGNYGSQVQIPSSYPSDTATENATSEQISPKDTTYETTEPPTKADKLCRPSLIHRSSSLNDTTQPLDALSMNTGPALFAIPKRLSLPCLPVNIKPGFPNIWAPSPEEKEFELQDKVKDRHQLVGFRLENGPVTRFFGLNT
jgi:hypothetical protein